MKTATKIASIILTQDPAAEMASDVPLALHPLLGRPLIAHVIETVRSVTDAIPVLVTGDEGTAIRDAIGDTAIPVQGPGSQGRAVLQAQKALPEQSDPVLVTYANTPLVTGETLQRLLERHRESVNTVTVLGPIESTQRPQTCAYCFDAVWLRAHTDHSLREGDVRDLVRAATDEGLPVATVAIGDPDEALRIHTRVDLARAAAALRRRINERWMLAGVTMIDPATTYVEPGVRIGRDTVIHPNTHLRGETHIGAHCTIGPNTIVEDCQIGDRCRVLASVLEQAVMEDEADIGPFGHLRKGARLCRGAHMGNFGEVKNATLGPGAKMGHFSYLGDADVGAEANIGAGTITCNYDGVRKHPTVIEAEAFIGSGSMLVAPVRIGERAKTGAGSVVTHDVPADSVAYGVPARVKKT